MEGKFLKEESHVYNHNPNCDFNSRISWRLANVAAQQELGLCSQRYRWPDCRCAVDPVFDGTAVRKGIGSRNDLRGTDMPQQTMDKLDLAASVSNETFRLCLSVDE